MKKIGCLLYLLYFSSLYASASKTDLINGYYLNNNRDTVRCKIKVPEMVHGAFDLFFKVAIEDSLGNTVNYYPGKHQIKGFGFDVNGKAYDYNLWKAFKQDVFVWRQMTGKKLNLYFYYYYTDMELMRIPASPRTDVFIVEGTNKKALAVSNILLNNIKNDFKKFFAGDDAILKLIDADIFGIKDIPTLVYDANRLADDDLDNKK